MSLLTVGALGASHKENEHRLPIHPHHIGQIDSDLREHLLLESGYGERYGVADSHLDALVAGMRSREQILQEADVLLLPKPTLSDISEMRDGQVLWGWPHCVQDSALTQYAIDKRLTLIAWEAMNHWTPSGGFVVHVFHLNNELAGYSSVMHALALSGSTGHYGRHLTAAVLGFGNTARGAITGLKAMGIHDITVLTMREVTAVASPIPAVVINHLDRREEDPTRTIVQTDDGPVMTAEFLASHDLVVNCVLQDVDQPLMFVDDDELKHFSPGHVIVDVSCDEAMGFSFARPTHFTEPTFQVGDGVTYYGVDHSPSYLWNSATWGISESLIPYLRSVMRGPKGWDSDLTISRAIEIREGVIQNPKILSFQGRAADHPHARLKTPDGVG
ncbi:MAG: N(5)-(carboxyethyl)ornithine synthase [Actinomycetes bacterium]